MSAASAGLSPPSTNNSVVGKTVIFCPDSTAGIQKSQDQPKVSAKNGQGFEPVVDCEFTLDFAVIFFTENGSGRRRGREGAQSNPPSPPHGSFVFPTCSGGGARPLPDTPDQTVERDWRQAMPRAEPAQSLAPLLLPAVVGAATLRGRESPHPLHLAARRRKAADTGRVSWGHSDASPGYLWTKATTNPRALSAT